MPHPPACRAPGLPPGAPSEPTCPRICLAHVPVSWLGSLRRRRRDARSFFLGHVSAEGAGGRGLAKLVTDHVLGHINRHMAPAVMDGDSMAHHLREDRAGPAPG